MRRLIIVSLMVGLAAACVLAAESEAPTTPIQKELENASGKELYREACKVCHAADSPDGEYTPMDLIQDQWTEFFDDLYVETHEAVIDSTHGNVPVVEFITEKMLEKIRKFAVDGAADSEHPMTCG